MGRARIIKMCLNEMYGEVCISKYTSGTFPVQNDLKQEDALSPLLFNFPLEYAIRMIQKTQVDLKWNQTHQLLVCADGVTLFGKKVNTIKKNTETVLDAKKEVGLELKRKLNI
jgi:hypothetical protein